MLHGHFLRLLHCSIRFAIDEGALLALEARACCLRVLTLLGLVVLKSSLEEVSVGEVEAALREAVLQHEAIKEGAVLVVLLGFAAFLSVRLAALETIIRVVRPILARDRLHLVRHALSVVTKRLTFFLLKILDCLA